MPITINGSGSITGVNVGGLPDGVVDTDMLADAAVTDPKLGVNTFVSYALIRDEKASTTEGGTFTAGAWQTRDLNTVVADPDSIVTIDSNQFTLSTAGSYLIKWSAPAWVVNRHQSRLYDVTNTASVADGANSQSHAAYPNMTRSEGAVRVTITGSTTYEIQHQCQTTRGTNGLGVGVDFDTEVYTTVEIYLES